MATRMQQRRGTAAQWTAANPVLGAGEIGFETDTNKFKIGNGSTAWTSLSYFVDGNAVIDGAPELLNTLNELAAALGDDPSFFTTVANNLSNHESDTTNVHGIADTSLLVTTNGTQTLTNKTITTPAGLVKGDVGLGNVDNTTDANKPVSTATQTALDLKAPLASPALSGIPTAPTANAGTNSTQVATTAYADAAVAALVDSAPAALNTLNELAQALNDDSDFAVTVTNSFASVQNSLSALSNSTSDTSSAVGVLEGNVVSISNALTITQNNLNTTNGAIDGLANSISDLSNSLITTQNSLASTQNSLATTNTNVDALSNSISAASGNITGLQNSLANTISDLSTHTSANTSVHGISNTLNLVYTNDLRLSDERTPISDSVTASKIASDAVETGKIANAAVTAAKLATNSVETEKIANGAVTDEKIANNIAQSHIVNLVTDLGLLASQSSVDLKAPLSSPALTGTPTAPTANTATNTTQIATTAFVQQEIAILTDSAPGLLNTLDELAAALGDDANFAATTANSIALKAPLASPTFTGLVTVAANGIAYTDGTQAKEGVPSRTPIISKTASYTLSAESERDSLIEVSSESGTTITIPLNSAVAYPVGTTLDILQTNTGQVTIAGDAGVTVNATPGLKLRTRWSSATLLKRDTNSWVVFGDLSA
jgi:hypothetical protein